MSSITTADGVNLYYEETGTGTPVVFVHEFAGDSRSWEPQVRHFARRYRCITFNARGYPPSAVPESSDSYSQDHARDDILAVLDGLDIAQAHIVGLSMGAFATLHFGIRHGPRALSLVVAGCGYGAHPDGYLEFQAHARENAALIRTQGIAHFASTYGHGPGRVQLKAKDPRGFAEFIRIFSDHSDLGSANTMAGYQGRRSSLYQLTDLLRATTTPTLIVAGDEDEPTLEPSLMLKRTLPAAALAVLPNSGHVLNLEEPALFNYLVEQFFQQVESGRWAVRTA
ncbi:MAG: alpha/beta hydrolase [Gammaproteobacteria bacterium]|nr:alpha/beta hydrolase [Gammaproteobacteria bacterium]